MSTYQLTIQFDNKGLTTLNAAGQLVTMVKSTGAGRPVAWIAFHPMQDNLITWTEDYSVYASSTQIQDGAQIITQSTQSANGGNTYTFSSGQFNGGQANVPANQYSVYNNDPNFEIDQVQMITSGLYQGAVVNGQSTQSPLNAVGVPYLETANFTPIEKIQVFASSYQNNGMVISSVSSQALLVDLTEKLTQTIHYNDATNQFALGPLSSAKALSSSDQRQAALAGRSR